MEVEELKRVRTLLGTVINFYYIQLGTFLSFCG